MPRNGDFAIIRYSKKLGDCMKLNIGNRITWACVAGQLVGDIVNIVLSENGNNETVAWLDVKVADFYNTVRICAVEMNLKMLDVKLVQG